MKPKTSQSACLFHAMLLAAFAASAQEIPAEATSRNNERLRKGLEQFPQADTNKDGILTLAEGRAFLAKMKKTGGGKPAAPAESGGSQPALADIAYGPHERNKLDFWKTESSQPSPVVIFIHGGGFRAGDKSSWRKNPLVPQLLAKGVSCAAINYRFRDSAPVQDILRDAARSVQFIRSKADEWNIDKSRIAAMGGSAGAGTSLWLATRDDLADPNASDPVLRESSRVAACVLNNTQATYDLTRWESFLGPADPAWLKEGEGAQFYGFKQESDAKTAAGEKVLAECDMLGWISTGDGPVLCTCNQADGPPKDRGHWLHHPKHAEAIQDRCEECRIECIVIRDEKQAAANPVLAFLLKSLGI